MRLLSRKNIAMKRKADEEVEAKPRLSGQSSVWFEFVPGKFLIFSVPQIRL